MITPNTIAAEYEVLEWADEDGANKPKKDATMALLKKVGDEAAMGAIDITHLGPDAELGDRFTYELKIIPIEKEPETPKENAE